MKITDHYQPIVQIVCVPHSNQLVSADDGGIVKIRDIRTMMCVQTLNIKDDLSHYT